MRLGLSALMLVVAAGGCADRPSVHNTLPSSESEVSKLVADLRAARTRRDAPALVEAAEHSADLSTVLVGRVAEPNLELPSAPLPSIADPASILAEARAINPQAGADVVLPAPARGSIGALLRSQHRLGSGATATFRIRFKANEPALALIEARPGARLRLQILTESGGAICSDDIVEGIAFCQWSPAQTQEFRLTLLNRGETVGFTLITN
jgi:hypothetical protein